MDDVTSRESVDAQRHGSPSHPLIHHVEGSTAEIVWAMTMYPALFG
jgi:hypothetical protein